MCKYSLTCQVQQVKETSDQSQLDNFGDEVDDTLEKKPKHSAHCQDEDLGPCVDSVNFVHVGHFWIRKYGGLSLEYG